MDANPIKGESNLLGTPPSTQYIDYQDGKLKEYIDDNSHTIWFEPALTQLIEYDRADRTPSDLVVAMGLCELMDDDLMGKIAKPKDSVSKELQLFGYYRDPITGKKKYGAIPTVSKEKENMNKEYEFSLREGPMGGWK
jgi:tRNA nucleotidyltransferase (CCA-adding enzyme)